MEARADALVLFGATGDLVRKKLIPAIYELAAAGRLGMPVIGVARSNWDDEKLRTHAHDVLNKSRTLDEDVFTELAKSLSMVVGDYNDPQTYQALAARLQQSERPVFYLAIPPSVFENVVEGGCRRPGEARPGHRRKTVRPGPGLRAATQHLPGERLRPTRHLPDRPLPR